MNREVGRGVPAEPRRSSRAGAPGMALPYQRFMAGEQVRKEQGASHEPSPGRAAFTPLQLATGDTRSISPERSTSRPVKRTEVRAPARGVHAASTRDRRHALDLARAFNLSSGEAD
ncbi:MAG: hypothetical protein ACYDH9_16885 [Limisphaerales bacterium]